MTKKFIYFSYRIEQAMVISKYRIIEFRIHKELMNAIVIHRKGMESVFNQSAILV